MQPLGVRAAPGEDHEVVGVSDEPAPLLLDRFVETVEQEISQERRKRSARGNAGVLSDVGLDECPHRRGGAVVSEPGFEPVAEELPGDSIEEAVKIRAHGEVPAVVHESFDSPGRRLAIQPPSPGERRGLEQAIEGRAQAGEDQPLQRPVLNRGDVELARVSVAAPQDHAMGPPRLVLAGPQAFGGEPECLGLEVVLGRGTRMAAGARHRSSSGRARSHSVGSGPSPRSDSDRSRSAGFFPTRAYCPHISAARAT